MYQITNMPTLPEAASASDAVKYIRSLVAWVGPGFHPDTQFADYVRGETGARSYPKAVADFLDSELDRAINLLATTKVTVYDVGIRVQHRLLREMGVR